MVFEKQKSFTKMTKQKKIISELSKLRPSLPNGHEGMTYDERGIWREGQLVIINKVKQIIKKEEMV